MQKVVVRVSDRRSGDLAFRKQFPLLGSRTLRSHFWSPGPLCAAHFAKHSASVLGPGKLARLGPSAHV